MNPFVVVGPMLYGIAAGAALGAVCNALATASVMLEMFETGLGAVEDMQRQPIAYCLGRP